MSAPPAKRVRVAECAETYPRLHVGSVGAGCSVAVPSVTPHTASAALSGRWSASAGAAAEGYDVGRVWTKEEADADDYALGFVSPGPADELQQRSQPARLPEFADTLLVGPDSELAAALAQLKAVTDGPAAPSHAAAPPYALRPAPPAPAPSPAAAACPRPPPASPRASPPQQPPGCAPRVALPGALPRDTWRLAAETEEEEGARRRRLPHGDSPVPSPPPLAPLAGSQGAVAGVGRAWGLAGGGTSSALRTPWDTQRPQLDSLPPGDGAKDLWRRFEAAAAAVAQTSQAPVEAPVPAPAARSPQPAARDTPPAPPPPAFFDEGDAEACCPTAGGGEPLGEEAPLAWDAQPQAPRAAHATQRLLIQTARAQLRQEGGADAARGRRAQAAPHAGGSALFSLGSGRAVPPVSAAARARARNMGFSEAGFAEGPEAENALGQQPPAAAAPALTSTAFSSAAGKALPPPSAAGLARAAGVLALDKAPPADGARGVLSAFSTGGGVTLHVSNAALARGAALLEGCAGDAPSPKPPPRAPVSGFKPPASTGRPTGAGGAPAPAAPARPRAYVMPKSTGVGAVTPQPTAQRAVPPAPPTTGGWHRAAAIAASPLPPPPPAAACAASGPMHDLHCGVGARLLLRAFFAGASPFQGLAPMGLRPATFHCRVRPDCAAVTAGNAAQATLPMAGPLGDLTPQLAHWALLSRHGAAPGLATPEWVGNAWRWIVWKLAATERAFPTHAWAGAAGRLLCADAVMQQLRLRYEREHNRAQRPILRRIFEGDTAPSASMCLLVSAVQGDQLELSDGWYPIKAQVDATLCGALRSGRLRVGDKLYVSCARKGGDENPGPPLEQYGVSWLIIGANGTRRAPWDSMLGAQPRMLLTPLRHVRPGGGPVPGCAITVCRVFALLHLEQADAQEEEEGGRAKQSWMRSDAAEALFAQRRAVRAETVMEAAAASAREAAQRAFEARLRTRAQHSPPDAKAEAAFHAQQQTRIAFDVQAALEAAGLQERRVTPMLKMRVCGFVPAHSTAWPGEALLTVWRPDETALSMLKEGASFVVTNAAAEAKGKACEAAQGGLVLKGVMANGQTLKLTTKAHTRWLRCVAGEGPLGGLRSGYVPRSCTPLAALGAPPPPPPAPPPARTAGEAAAIEEARRVAAVSAAQAGLGAAACNAAAQAAVAQLAPAQPAVGAPPCAPPVLLGALFDSCCVLLHAAPAVDSGARGSRQCAFFVDCSLVGLAQPGDAAERVQLLVLELSCHHEGGFVPLNQDPPCDAGAPDAFPFPVLALRHATFARLDAHNRLLCARGDVLTECAPPPRPGTGGSLGASTARVAAELRAWADGQRPLLHSLRARARRLTQGHHAEWCPRDAPPQPQPRTQAQPQAPLAEQSGGRSSEEAFWGAVSMTQLQALTEPGGAHMVGRREGSPQEATLGAGDTQAMEVDPGEAARRAALAIQNA